MVEQTGINLPVVDLGWPPLSAITWGSPIAPFVIPMTMLINIIMLAINQTKQWMSTCGITGISRLQEHLFIIAQVVSGWEFLHRH